MKWAEMIRVRSSAEGITDLYNGLTRVISTLRQKTEIDDAILLIHALYVGDLAIILLWNGAGRPVQSPEGISLANSFKEYGTVEHAVWLIASEDMVQNSMLPGSQMAGGKHR